MGRWLSTIQRVEMTHLKNQQAFVQSWRVRSFHCECRTFIVLLAATANVKRAVESEYTFKN